jgi:hypothetical protein
MPAGGRVLAEGDAAQNTEIGRLGDVQCHLNSDHGGVSSNTTPQSTNLSRPVAASTTHVGRLYAFYTAGTTGDIKFGLSVPSGTTVRKLSLRSGPASDTSNTPGSVYFGYETVVTNLTAPGTGGASGMVAELTVVFTTSTTAGNAVLQYAQGTSDGGTATILRSYSIWEVTKSEGV